MTGDDDLPSAGRRRFLVRTGWVVAGVTVTAVVSFPLARRLLPALPTFAEPELEDALTWVQALPDGRIRFFCPRMEMGQGATLGLCQVVAEELNVGQHAIECVLPATDQVPPFKMTVGSESISSFFGPVSHGAARLREVLRAMAARQAGCDPERIEDARGGFVLPGGNAIGYARVVPSQPVVLTASSAPEAGGEVPRYALRKRSEHRAIGRGWPHHDLQAMVTGRATYSRDVALPGMLFGQVVRPPAFGAVLLDVDVGDAESMPGVAAVVVDRKKGFVAVVADTPFVLAASVKAIKARWQVPEDLDQGWIEARLDVARVRAGDDFEHTISEEGDVAAGRRAARIRVAARYDTPFAAHAAMEPRSAVVSVGAEKVEVWCGSQDPFFVRGRVAKVLGRAARDVVVHSHRMGGGFGGRIFCQASEEAALLSAAVGRAVRVQWDRAAEFQNGYLHPAFSHAIDAGVTGDGRISHWAHDFVSSPIATGPLPGSITRISDRVLADFGTSRGSTPPYRLPNRRIRYSDIRTPVPVGAWRGLGAAPNAFAVESMMDELSVAAGMDPIAFRLKNLPPAAERLANVLREVAGLAGWGSSRLPPHTGRGVACAVYKGETAVAVVAEVVADHAARALRVTRVWCVQDCGLMVNPDQVESLVMGNLVWGCSMALKERITLEAGSVRERNFDTYPVLRCGESPEMIVRLVGSGEAPVAVGESALPPVAPAIASAVHAATGRRVRRLPVSYSSVFPGGHSRLPEPG